MAGPRARRMLAALLAGAALAACTSARASPSTTGTPTTNPPATTRPAPSSAPSTPTTATSTPGAAPSTSAPAATSPPSQPPAGDRSFASTPVGTCDTIAPGAIGYRNETGNVANFSRQIGASDSGRPIWVEHWGTEDGPQVLVLGQVHGDECAPAWLVRAIRERPPITFGIWLVPTLNPDGLAAHTRRTAQGIDPNRDGFRIETPEARALMDLTAQLQPALTIHVHSPYQWIGAHNDGLAAQVAQAMSDAVGWGPIYNAGTVDDGDLAFLWEGQELVLPGHPSVLIEFPAVAEAESPAPPDPSQKDVTSVDDVARLALLMRDAFYAAMGEP